MKINNSEDLSVNVVNITIQRILLSSAKLTFPVKAGNQSSGARLTKTLPGYNLDSRILKQNYYRAKNKYKQNRKKQNNLDDLRDKSKAYKAEINKLKRKANKDLQTRLEI